jgi:dTDP-4-dehydrorhamnose 3,5-epimerase
VDGVLVIDPVIITNKGIKTFKVYNNHDFQKIGITERFVQENQRQSRKYVIRGVDIQLEYPQGKLIHCLYGSIFDVAVDLREDSVPMVLGLGKNLFLRTKNSYSCQLVLLMGFYHKLTMRIYVSKQQIFTIQRITLLV